MSFEVQMASLTVGMLGFQLIFAQGEILECLDSCKCVYQIQVKGHLVDFLMDSALTSSTRVGISRKYLMMDQIVRFNRGKIQE